MHVQGRVFPNCHFCRLGVDSKHQRQVSNDCCMQAILNSSTRPDSAPSFRAWPVHWEIKVDHGVQEWRKDFRHAVHYEGFCCRFSEVQRGNAADLGMSKSGKDEYFHGCLTDSLGRNWEKFLPDQAPQESCRRRTCHFLYVFMICTTHPRIDGRLALSVSIIPMQLNSSPHN
jgi:hypothetical protein